MNKIKLDITDRKILSELDKNCRIAKSELAKKVHKSRETVTYRIEQLQQRGIINKFITSINPNKLGYHMFKVYLKLENKPEEREKFLKELNTNKDIYWMGISDGAFDMVLAILSTNIPEYYTKINNLLSRWQHLIVSKTLGTMVDTRQYNKKFFTNGENNINSNFKNIKQVIFGGDIIKNEIDKLDSKILNILANNARIPLTKLARETNSTVEIIRGKIKKLEQKGIILGYRIAVDFNKLELEFFKAIIYFKKLSESDEQGLYEWIKQEPSSLYYIRCLAPWEVEIELAVENYQQFNNIINRLRERFPQVIRNYEHLIMIHETWMPAYNEMLKEKNKN